VRKHSPTFLPPGKAATIFQMPTQSETSKLIFSGVILVIGVVLLLCGNSILTHTLNTQGLIWSSGGIGVVIAAVIACLVRDLSQYVRAAFMTMLAVGFALTSVSAASLINFRFSPQQKTIVLAEVIDKTSKPHADTSTYYLITNKNPALPLKVSYQQWMNTPLSYPVKIAVIPGYFGFPYIQGFAEADATLTR